MIENVPCLLIGGPGRSGTNILKEVLSSHPSVLAFPFETRFTVDPDGIAPTLRLLRSEASPFVSETALRRLDELLARMESRSLMDRFFRALQAVAGDAVAHRSYRDWDLTAVFSNFNDCRKELLVDLTSVSYRGIWAGAQHGAHKSQRLVSCTDRNGDATRAMRRFLRQLYATALARASKKYYVDDNTYNLLYAAELLDILPEAYFLHMVRDPRDVVTSYMNQRWTPKALTDAIQYYCTVMENWLGLRDKLPAGKFMEVHLEDLCRDPKSTLTKILSWVDWPFDNAILHTDLGHSNSGRWQRDLNLSDQRRLDESLEKYVRIFEYVPMNG